MSIKNYLRPVDLLQEKNRLLSMSDDTNKYAVITKWDEESQSITKWHIDYMSGEPISIKKAALIKDSLEYQMSKNNIRKDNVMIIPWSSCVDMMINRKIK